MTNEELQVLVEKLSIDWFHREFQHLAIFNARLQTTGGRYHLNDHHIDINPKLLDFDDQLNLIGVIKHELCHYHLHLANEGYRHRDAAFKHLLTAVDGLRYAPKFPNESSEYSYECLHCHQMYIRRRKIDTKRFRCGKCRGELIKKR